MDVRTPLVAHRQPPVPRQPRQRPLDHPPMPSQPLARVDAAPGDARLYPSLTERLSAAGKVVALVGVQLRRALARAARAARRTLDRLDGVHQLLQDLRVVYVRGGERYGERDAPSVRNNVALRARFAAIRRVLADLFAPLFAATLAESRHALDQSIRSASPRRSSKTRCRRRHTPAFCQSRSLRQQVEPEPQPISLGSISQGTPLLRTKTMPVRAARSSTRGLPPFGFGGSGGKSGSMVSHSSSLTSSFPIPASVASAHEGFARSSKPSSPCSLAPHPMTLPPVRRAKAKPPPASISLTP